jgi:hypothetical protein
LAVDSWQLAVTARQVDATPRRRQRAATANCQLPTEPSVAATTAFRPGLRAGVQRRKLLLFNNLEGKASARLDESRADKRVELYLALRREHKRRGGGWRKHARRRRVR